MRCPSISESVKSIFSLGAAPFIFLGKLLSKVKSVVEGAFTKLASLFQKTKVTVPPLVPERITAVNGEPVVRIDTPPPPAIEETPRTVAAYSPTERTLVAPGMFAPNRSLQNVLNILYRPRVPAQETQREENSVLGDFSQRVRSQIFSMTTPLYRQLVDQVSMVYSIVRQQESEEWCLVPSASANTIAGQGFVVVNWQAIVEAEQEQLFQERFCMIDLQEEIAKYPELEEQFRLPTTTLSAEERRVTFLRIEKPNAESMIYRVAKIGARIVLSPVVWMAPSLVVGTGPTVAYQHRPDDLD